MIFLAAVGLLPGCMFVAHQGHESPSQEVSSQDHKTSEENEGVAATHHEEADAAQTHDGHDGMSMMHGSKGWRWLMGGAMVVMMALVIL